jgi:hypothetical protein
VDAPILGNRGRRLWAQVTGEGPELRPGERVLLEEACRTADRLDVLDRILRGDVDSWMRLDTITPDGSVVRVVVNNALAEVRQQQIALKQILAELRQSRSATGKPGRPGTGSTSTTGGGRVAGVADLTARIRDRRASPAG